MKETRLSPRWPLTILAILLASTAGLRAHAAEGSFERTLAVTGPVELDVSTGSGHINVRAGDSSNVHINGTIKASQNWHLDEAEAERKVRYLESNPPIEQHGNFIRIGHIEDHELAHNISISYDLVVPAATRLRSQTGSGSQSVEGIQGPVKAATGSGSVKVENIGDEVRAETGSGDVQVDSVKGATHASTGSGSIRASGLGSSFVASTGSGSIKLEQTGPGDGKVETGSGSIELQNVRGALRVRTGSGNITAQGEPTGEWSLHTGSGRVLVRLPSGAAFELNAHTSSGHISTSANHPVTVQGTIGRGELRGKVGGGGPLLELETGSGNIQIE
jgi:DUF4097 and DUF4098 domain-containing protein YvlB